MQIENSNASIMETATFGGGCFWCTEAYFQDLKGVKSVVSGYSGGQSTHPTYREICTGMTGHAEVIKITFDASVISFRILCDLFFTLHDPTTLNRQGADEGTQYRSVIYYHSPDQKESADAAKTAAQAFWPDPIVTEITAAPPFYEAEAYHQNYYKNNPNQGYCRIVIEPKVKKIRQHYVAMLNS